MKKHFHFVFSVFLLSQFFACNNDQLSDSTATEEWVINSQEDWQASITAQANLKIADGKLEPKDSVVTFQSILKKFDENAR